MRRELGAIEIATCLILLQAIPELITAQSQIEKSFDTLVYSAEKIDSLEYVDSEINTNLVVENGIFFGGSHLGVEALLLESGRNMFAGFFVGTVGNNLLFGSAWVGGITLGHQVYLRDGYTPLESNVLEFYFRSGSGVGIGLPKRDFENDTEFYGGVHVQAMMGAQLKLFDRFWLYTQGGGRLLWFPAVEEIGFLGTPIVSVGFRISTDFEMFTY